MVQLLTYSKDKGLPLVRPSQSTPSIGSGNVLSMALEIAFTSSGFVIMT